MARPKGSKEKTLNQLWEENKAVLEAADYTEYTFKSRMEALMRTNNKRVPGAWKIFKHGVAFTSKETIGAENLVDAIKDQEDYNTFRKEVIGWKNKVNYNNFHYDKETNKYSYTRQVKDENGELVEAKWVFTLITGSAGSQYWKWTQVK